MNYKFILSYHNPKICGDVQEPVLTYAHSRTLAKWDMCEVRPTAFVFLCESVWVELLRFWEVRWIKVYT